MVANDPATPPLDRALDLETLDPTNWDSLRRLGHQMLDDQLDMLASLRDRPVWQPLPSWVRDHFDGSVPRSGASLANVYADYRRTVASYPLGNLHPRFWGWVIGNGTATGMLAELLAGGLNANVFGAAQSPQLIERQVLRWLGELFGYPADASGLLLSGASAANLVGLTVARRARAPFDVAEDGLSGGPQMVVYGSTETHNSVARAAEMLGLGQKGYRRVAVDANFRIDLAALRRAITVDRDAGRVPFAVVANLGTVATGACDDLVALADLAATEGLWLHVDGAIGAALALLPGKDPRLAGLDRADSIACDLHKWFHVPYEAGCLLVRDRQAHELTFHAAARGNTSDRGASYLGRTSRGAAAEPEWFTDFGPQLSRGFRALKVWFTFRELGADRLGRMVAKNLDQARYLAARVESTPELELLAPPPLNIVCFRHRGQPNLDPSALDAWNEDLLGRLHESGVAVPTYARVNGAFALRVSIANHRTTRTDLDLLIETVLALARVTNP